MQPEPPPPSLDILIEGNSPLTVLFQRFVQREHSEENFEFCVCVYDFRKMFSEAPTSPSSMKSRSDSLNTSSSIGSQPSPFKTPRGETIRVRYKKPTTAMQVAHNTAVEIYNVHVMDGSVREVNISHKARSGIKGQLLRRKVHDDLFDRAFREVQLMVQEGPYKRFLRSSDYRDAQARLSAPPDDSSAVTSVDDVAHTRVGLRDRCRVFFTYMRLRPFRHRRVTPEKDQRVVITRSKSQGGTLVRSGFLLAGAANEHAGGAGDAGGGAGGGVEDRLEISQRGVYRTNTNGTNNSSKEITMQEERSPQWPLSTRSFASEGGDASLKYLHSKSSTGDMQGRIESLSMTIESFPENKESSSEPVSPKRCKDAWTPAEGIDTTTQGTDATFSV